MPALYRSCRKINYFLKLQIFCEFFDKKITNPKKSNRGRQSIKGLIMGSSQGN